MNFKTRMHELARTFTSAPERALGLAVQLEADILAARSVDPEQLGWARDYRIRCLYRLARHSDGLTLLASPPAQPMKISTKNSAWLHSVGAEMAMHVGAPAQALTLIGEALDLRTADDDFVSMKMAVETGFALLRQSDAPDLLAAWYAEIQTRVATTTGEHASALYDALEHITTSPWFAAEFPELARHDRDGRALHTAAQAGDAAEVARLLTAGALVDFHHPGFPGLPTATIAAAFRGRTPVVFALLAAGASLHTTNIQGRTALHLAADQNHAETVTLLVQSGAPLDVRDFVQHTPLHLAAWQNHLASLHVLVRAGASLAARDRNGDTALGLAATEPVPEVMRALLAAGADREAINDHGQTPLMRAAMEGRTTNVQLLLDAGADRTRLDRHGRTALDWARAEDHSKAAGLLVPIKKRR